MIHASDIRKKKYYPADTAASREERKTEALLEWLRYPKMDDRRDSVEQAYKDTFQWIFEQPRAGVFTMAWHWLTSSQTHASNTNFVIWLRQESGIFWIYGKPGAGKSTLMKFITEDPRLRTHAKAWAGSHRLSIGSFYFWKRGTKLQKSLCGLYRAILWQLVEEDRMLASEAFPGWQISAGSTEPSLESLNAALVRLVSSRRLQRKFLILIDGLDEYEDEESDNVPNSQERFSATLRQLAGNEAVKIVIASRPDRVFESYFSHGSKLAVHELTAQDLKSFVHDKLVNDKTIRPAGETYSADEIKVLNYLVQDLVDRSQGVFLWTRVVTNLVRAHVREYGDLYELHRLVEKLDPDMGKLFDQIMARILQLDRKDRLESLRYLALTLHWSSTVTKVPAVSPPDKPQVSVLGVGCRVDGEILTPSWLEDNLQSLIELGRNHSRIDGRIRSLCFGLLETCPDDKVLPSTWKVVRPIHRALYEYLLDHKVLRRLTTVSRGMMTCSMQIWVFLLGW